MRTPLRPRSGASAANYTIRQDQTGRIILEPVRLYYLIVLFFKVFGLLFLGFGVLLLAFAWLELELLAPAAVGLFMGGLALFISKKARAYLLVNIIIDPNSKTASLRDGDMVNPTLRVVQFSDVKELEVIEKTVRSTRGRNEYSHTFQSYEVNFVLQDNQRVNVQDHGAKDKIYELVQMLKDLLKCPVHGLS